MSSFSISDIRSRMERLMDSSRKDEFEGYDPFDGLNSRLFRTAGFHRSAFLRLAWIQFFKRSPLNFRALAVVPKTFNPKAGALFLSGVLRASRDPAIRAELLGKLRQSVIRTRTGLGWGYPFDWQARAFYVAQGTPNIVTSVYVGMALLDSYKLEPDPIVKELLLGIREFILNEMIIWEKDETLCFAYIPGKMTEVHNANLWAAAFLSCMESFWPARGARNKVRKAVRFSLSDLGPDGHWPYGTEPHHRWMDNFHTGFNLEALMEIYKNEEDGEIKDAIRKSYRYYLAHLFSADGLPKYYTHSFYPLDVHTFAESIILFSKITNGSGNLFNNQEKLDAALKRDEILHAAFTNFWDNKGYFYYQKSRFILNRIPYLRWSQAWMFYALSFYPDLKNESH